MVEYNIFLSWSGNVSKAIAEAWRNWLPLAMQGAKPWMSSADIPKGTPWFGELADQLKGIQIGIICVTPQNLTAPSIHFEVGALSKTVTQSAYVCPYLFNVKNSDLGFPLSQFQTTIHGHDDTKQLFHTLHRALQTSNLTEQQLDAVFEKWWPDLERSLKSIALHTTGTQPPHRSDREILEEVLELVRDVQRRPWSTGQTVYLDGASLWERAGEALGGKTPSRSTVQPGPLVGATSGRSTGPAGPVVGATSGRSTGPAGPVVSGTSGRSTGSPLPPEERKEKNGNSK